MRTKKISPNCATLKNQNEAVSPNNTKSFNKIITRKRAAILSNSPKNSSPITSVETKTKQKYNNKNETLDSHNVKTQTYVMPTQMASTQTDLHNKTILTTNELLGTHWISDEIVTQYADLLNNKLLVSKSSLILNPLIVHAVKCTEDFDHFLDPLNIKERNVLILPINDSKKLIHAGGSHWSILIYDKLQEKFYHYDSNNNYNLHEAKVVGGKIFSYLGQKHKTLDITNIHGPQQMNSYDCGIYMLLVIEHIVSTIIHKKCLNLGFFKDFKPSEADLIVKRSTLAYILNNLSSIKTSVLISLLASELASDYDVTRKSEDYNSAITNKSLTLSSNQPHHKKCRNNRNGVENRVITDNHVTVSTKLAEKSEFQGLQNTTESSGCRGDGKNHHQVLILADSHGRNLYSQLAGKVANTARVTSIFKPNAQLGDVVRDIKGLTSNLTKEDAVIVIGGANNRLSNNEDVILSKFKEILEVTSHTNVILSALPIRHIQPWTYQSVDYINSELQYIVRRKGHATFLPIDHLPRHMYTRHGLHYNKRGKARIAEMLGNILNQIFYTPNASEGSRRSVGTDQWTSALNTPSNDLHNSTSDSQGQPTLISTISPSTSLTISQGSPVLGFLTPDMTCVERKLTVINRLESKKESAQQTLSCQNSILTKVTESLSPTTEIENKLYI